MSETYGFFEATWDEEGINPVTSEPTGWWDTAYLWKEFMDYFALFVGNGVFVSPVNQLKVIAGSGLTVTVKPGWAFINGHWYHNDTDKVIAIPPNNTVGVRQDSIKIRLSEANRSILALDFVDETTVSRGENTYDLKLADILVYPGALTMNDMYITDTRGNTDVCGFVKGLMDIVDTKDLFKQFEAIFNNWFETVKDQVTGDLAIRLQMEFEQINKDLVDFYNNVLIQIENYKNEMQIIVNDARNIVADFVDKDFVIPLNNYYFSENKCIIPNEMITANTLVDVYWTKESMTEAIRSVIYVDSEPGQIVLTAGRQPSTTLSAVIRVRVR